MEGFKLLLITYGKFVFVGFWCCFFNSLLLIGMEGA